MKKIAIIISIIFIGLNQNSFSKSMFSEIEPTSVVFNIDKMVKVDEIAVVLCNKNTLGKIDTKVIKSNKREISIEELGILSEKGSSDRDKKIFPLFKGKKVDYIKINDLVPETKYYFFIINPGTNEIIEKTSIVTLASEPLEQAGYIIFKNQRHDEITLMFKPGSGNNRIAVISKDKSPALPIDGKSYKANTHFIAFESLIAEETFCVFNGSGNEVTINNLEYGKYYFQVFEYNGENKSTNYLLTKAKNNPRVKVLPLPPPVALEAINKIEGGFTAKWKKVKGAIYYEIDIAMDESFNNVLELYNRMDIGNIDEMEIIELERGTYYYRLRAFGKDSKSIHSNIIKVNVE